MRPYPLKIAAGQAVPITVKGNYVRIKSAAVPVMIESKANSESAELEQGDAVTLTPFREIYLSHGSGSEQTVIVYVGDGTHADSSKVGGNVLVAAQAVGPIDAGPFTVDTIVSAFRASEARKMLLLQNIGVAGNIFIRFGGGAPSTANGIKLTPGQAIMWDGLYVPQDPISAIADVAGCVLYFARGT